MAKRTRSITSNFDKYYQKNNWKLSLDEPGSKDALLITAKREPEVPGTHTVTYSSSVDELVFTHQAKSRKGFAEGAVVAAHWLVGKKGVFDMADLLRFS